MLPARPSRVGLGGRGRPAGRTRLAIARGRQWATALGCNFERRYHSAVLCCGVNAATRRTPLHGVLPSCGYAVMITAGAGTAGLAGSGGVVSGRITGRRTGVGLRLSCTLSCGAGHLRDAGGGSMVTSVYGDRRLLPSRPSALLPATPPAQTLFSLLRVLTLPSAYLPATRVLQKRAARCAVGWRTRWRGCTWAVGWRRCAFAVLLGAARFLGLSLV